MMMLVIDITKGIQTQTAECLIIGEILCNRMVVVLNKIDLVPEEKRQITNEKVNLLTYLRKSIFSTFHCQFSFFLDGQTSAVDAEIN